MHKLIDYICEELEGIERKVSNGGQLSMAEIQYMDTLAHAKKNLIKAEEMADGGMDDSLSFRSYGRDYRSYDGRDYARDGYYYDGGMSNRRGRAANGRFVSRDASEMARRLRDMMQEAPDEHTKQEIQKLAEKMESM